MKLLTVSYMLSHVTKHRLMVFQVMEVSSPTTSSVLLGQSQIHLLESAYELTVRTVSPLGESADSVPAQVLPDLLSAIRHGVSLDPNLEMPMRNVSTLLRNPPLGAPANSLDQASMIHRENGSIPEVYHYVNWFLIILLTSYLILYFQSN